MARFYIPILLLQLFCLYLVYSRSDEQKWYWIIFLFPLIGSLFFLYSKYYSRQNMDSLSEEIRESFISNYKIDKLEMQLKHAETIANRLELANEHEKVGNWSRALDLYTACRTGIYVDDVDLLSGILKIHYERREYQDVISLGKKLINDKVFQKSKDKVKLAWAYYFKDDLQKAEQTFISMNNRFANYEQRFEFAKFLSKLERKEEAMQLLNVLIDEIESMERHEKRLVGEVYNDIRNYAEGLK